MHLTTLTALPFKVYKSTDSNFFVINPPSGVSKCISRSYFDPAVNPTLNNGTSSLTDKPIFTPDECCIPVLYVV